MTECHGILVVDDEPDLERLVRQRMRRDIREGRYKFYFAHDGVEALERLAEHDDIDMMLSDINMPRMDGLALLEQIQRTDSDLRAVIVSAYGDMKNIRTAMNRGAFDFITKPIDFEDLHITIERTLSNMKVWREALASRDRLVALQQELDVASQMQQSILTTTFPSGPDHDVFASMLPAKEVGGDFFDVVNLEAGRIGIAVADVSDKGVHAAMFMMASRTLLKGASIGLDVPGEVLREVNNLLVEDNKAAMFVTVFYGIYDPATGILTYSNGGHNPPVIVRADGSSEELPTTEGIALGVMEDMPFGTASVSLGPGDFVVLFTDGVTEAENADGEQFGLQRLFDLFAGRRVADAKAANAAVFEAVHEFAGDYPQSDDITCVTLTRAGRAAGARPAAEPAGRVTYQSFSVETRVEEIERISDIVDALAEKDELPKDIVFQVKLSLEEVLMNVINHGHDDDEIHEVDILLTSTSESLKIEITDDGKPFDPLHDAPEPDTEASIEDRKIGGLGVYLVRELMDEVLYRREGDRNHLVLIKRRDA